MFFITLSMFPSISSAGAWENRRSNHEEVAVYDHYRIFYSLSGKDALPRKRQIDSNNNQVPDFIESVRNRLIDADSFFQHEVGLKPPLKGKRYIGRAHYIDVNVLDFSIIKRDQKMVSLTTALLCLTVLYLGRCPLMFSPLTCLV
jgi:hypothetical protein